jgi:Tol biopolymer transport system component/DNA-binding winged helix-turn-helix (wHTH) protein
MSVGEKQTYRFGPFELDTQCGQLRKEGVGLKLQGQPVQILEILLEKSGQLVTREELRERLWTSDTFVDFDHSLNTAIKKLRQALGDEAETPHYIETLPRRGYRFIAEVIAEDRPRKNFKPDPDPEDMVGKVGATLADVAFNARTDSSRRPVRLRWIVTLSAGLLAIAAATYWLMKHPPLPRIVGSHALTHTGYRKVWDEANGIDQRLLTDGERVIFQENRPSGLRTMQVSRTGGDVSEMLTSSPNIAALRDISKDGSQILDLVFDQQTFTFDAWVHPLTGGPGRLVVKDAKSPTWIPGGHAILFARNEKKRPNHDSNYLQGRTLYRVNSDGTDLHRLSELPDINLLDISPDGGRIRFMSAYGSQLWEANSDGSNPHRLLSDKSTTLMGDWSPDGKYFFFTRWSGDQHDLWVAPEMKYPWVPREPVRLTSGPMSIVSPVVSKDGRQLYAVAIERHGELAVYDRRAAKFVPFISGLPACYVDFSRDGQWITYVSYPEGSLWRSRADGSERRQLTVPPMGVLMPVWSPDQKLIAFVDLANGDRRQMSAYTPSRIFVVSADGGGPMLLAEQGGDPTWSPDGRSIAYVIRLPDRGHELRIIDLASMRSSAVPGSKEQNMISPRWSPDGKYLAAMDFGHSKLAIYNFGSKTWTDVFTAMVLDWPSWSRDSKSIYVEAGHIQNAADSLVQVGIDNHKAKMITPLNAVRYTAFFYWNGGWFGLTPDDRPMTTLDTGIEEIYAFDLEYK